jgi:hypothetical protein
MISGEMENIQNGLAFPDAFFEEGFSHLRKSKKRIDEIVDNYFKGLEEQLH